MEQKFDFDDLFVFDLANNHQGSVEHGLNVIRGVAKPAQKYGIKASVKFQFRQLKSFIHPAHREKSGNKHVGRFLSTELKRTDYEKLKKEIEKQGLLSICTPFDEESVDIVCDMGFDLMKVASCSATDWPLLERISNAGLPVICSTGGITINQIDDLVSFFTHRGVDFALMYCVSIYPIPADDFNLNMIELMRERYSGVKIGWSTHEDPNDTVPVQIAVSKGAQMFERHVGIETGKIKLNAYSSTPEQIDAWLASYRYAKQLCGANGARNIPTVEQDSVNSLQRCVYARKPIKKGTTVSRDQIYFAMPLAEESLTSGLWKDGIVALGDIKLNEPLITTKLAIPERPSYHLIKAAIHDVKVLLNEARVTLNSDFDVEYSHHYGVPNFREFGAVIINCINRKYCKKIIVQLPGQKHPSHYHKRKEETFQVLYGMLNVNIEGHIRTLQPGETCLVQPGVWHSFWTDTGCVFEEVSTTHYNDDSFYADKAINNMKRSDRKTKVHHWGRFELVDYLGEMASDA